MQNLDWVSYLFFDEYRSGKFFTLAPPAFKELVLQANEEGLPLDENKGIVTKYAEQYGI
ncbi:hypothetical protein [Pseudoalteromonas sp. S558]|jgi:hypothetical protein|uniref:hypothetical protein n=1 Tax=Pseudoalteromonas sp. S558 TaxID=2066515 RepID=UPI00148752B8|nr:hypothetical protein [Pseudoalteromonas sp. S558]